MKLSQYDSDFADAMALKLKLNRQQRLRGESALAEIANRPEGTGTKIRDSIIDQILDERPGLSREKLSSQMASLGF